MGAEHSLSFLFGGSALAHLRAGCGCGGGSGEWEALVRAVSIFNHWVFMSPYTEWGTAGALWLFFSFPGQSGGRNSRPSLFTEGCRESWERKATHWPPFWQMSPEHWKTIPFHPSWPVAPSPGHHPRHSIELCKKESSWAAQPFSSAASDPGCHPTLGDKFFQNVSYEHSCAFPYLEKLLNPGHIGGD
jgi:hypothetical protein